MKLAFTILVVLIVLAAVLLTIVVLLQNGKDGGLATNFTAANQALGVRQAASSLEKGFEGRGNNVEAAEKVGEAIGQRAKDKGIDCVVFDRGGYLYHGRVKALAEGARKAGLEF